LNNNQLDLNDRRYKTATQNLESIFSPFPVNHRRTLKVNLD